MSSAIGIQEIIIIGLVIGIPALLIAGIVAVVIIVTQKK